MSKRIMAVDAAEIILKNHPDARIVMISSLAYGDTFERAKSIGTKGFVDIRIQTAAAYEMLGKSEEARGLLARALSDAEPDGLVTPLVENYGCLRLMLAREIKSGLIAKIIQLGEGAKGRKAENARPSAFEALTPREFEIVNLMARRLSNREIAERLFLSEGSVKQYVNQIYSKLQIEGDTRTKRKRLSELFPQKT